ncbi:MULTISPECIES: DUF2231 domain-containing protein [unclassified Janibacter]|uniref:DUF2231 domain-containing protein n=1 Tax=unclassified Janibacter TaxID=2649294 RepID=UPI003CFE6ECB
MEIFGLPVHPLVVHAVVVLVPLTALVAMAYGLRPGWRWALRWPMLVLGLVSAAATQLASMSGESLIEAEENVSAVLHSHEEWAEKLQLSVWVMAAVIVLAWWVLPVVTRLVGGTDRAARKPGLVLPTTALLVIVPIAVLVLVALTGDAGARAVWG